MVIMQILMIRISRRITNNTKQEETCLQEETRSDKEDDCENDQCEHEADSDLSGRDSP